MAQLVSSSQLSAVVRAALNAQHALGGGFPHNDGPEWSNADPPVEQVLAGPSPSTATQAAALIVAAKAFINLHFGYADAVNGDKIFAHNVADGANTLSSNMDAWSSIEATLREASRLFANDLGDRYEKHRLNTGGAWHTTVDTLNYLGSPAALPVGATDQQIAERLNLLKALIADHVIKQGGTHASADTGNVSSVANIIYDATTGMDWDKLLALCTDLRAKFIAHLTSGGIHAVNDSANAVTATAPALPSGWNNLVNEIITDWDLHVVNTTYHNFADSDNALGLGSVTTVAGMLAAAQSIYTKVLAHVRAAPRSRAWRAA